MAHCNRFRPVSLTRRELLCSASTGFGAVALAGLWGDQSRGMSVGATHFPPQVRNVIFLYMDGGVSQMDSFDPKPRLTRENGKRFGMKREPTQFDDNGNTLGTLWKFRQCGESGIPVSSLFPYISSVVDELTVVRSMVSNFSEHNAANYFLHSGYGQSGRPSMGAWTVYGLGSESQNLPGFVVLNGGLIPSGGIDCFAAGFLSAQYQATILRNEFPALPNISPSEALPGVQQTRLQTVRALDSLALERVGPHDAMEAAIANSEIAYRMQAAVPELTDIGDETAATRRLYGLDAAFKQTQTYGRQCLLARRLVERGVRFVELTCPYISGCDRWDAHTKLYKNHTQNARAVDQPIAGLLVDLKQRGLLDETLVVWTGEFGRTPFVQGSNGRDHNPYGFSLWMAGGGLRKGMIYGATDEYGYKVVENRVEIHDLHATMLHLLGLDHTRLTYRYSSRDMRLTDVHGKVVSEIMS
ncbi:MAG: DUF1501 domain-containing protein [Pirellulaceae bacterium]|nr:DUF1501 domain-containing protein [Pirellulaceae bacterium]